MAYAALLSLAQVLGDFLTAPFLTFEDLQVRIEQVKSLQSNVYFLQKLLEEFPGNRSLMMKQLERRIIDAAYQVENILACELSDSKLHTAIFATGDPEKFPIGGFFNKLGCCLGRLEDVAERAKQLSLRGMFKDFGTCIELVHSIVEDAAEVEKILDMKKALVGVGSLKSTSSPTDAPIDRDTTKVGVSTDLILMKERIFGRNSALQIIPITGMGGIGKTSLAKSVYEDPQSVQHFDVRLWATVSEQYNVHKILMGILSDINKAHNHQKDRENEKDVASLIVLVHKGLVGRRFLIVVDDIWNVEAWDKVRNALPDNRNGSRILLTSRLVEVAARVDSSSKLHQMQLLNEDQSWALFQKQVFGQQTCPVSLEKTGKIIARNCKGLPLAIVVIAGLLKLNHKQDYWDICAKNISEATAATPDDQLIEVLSPSYDNLPPHLKACFLYMSIFPEDEEIHIKRLVRLWVAEGFLKPKRDKSLEEAAEEYLVGLVDRNLITANKKRFDGRIKTCRIHDILRELSSRKAKEERFFLHIIQKSTNNVMSIFTGKTTSYLRRVGIHTIADSRSIMWDTGSKPVRSLIFSYYHTPPSSLLLFRLLRVLDALQISFHSGSSSVHVLCSLVYLRYLALTYVCNTSGVHLKSIRNLKNLETLIVDHRREQGDKTIMFGEFDVIFPVLELPKLRHFVMVRRSFISGAWYRIGEWDQGICISNSLQTLSGVTNLHITQNVIKILVNVVKLKMKYEKVRQWGGYALTNLVSLQHLEDLCLRFYHDNVNDSVTFLPKIGFPDGLKKLSLNRTVITWESMSVIGSLPNLEVLKLDDCWLESKEWETVEETFMSLKYLKLNINNLYYWKVDSSHFPCLEQLIIRGTRYLQELPAEVGEIYTLRKLDVRWCPKHIRDSAREIQEEQQSYDNYMLEVVGVNEPWSIASLNMK